MKAKKFLILFIPAALLVAAVFFLATDKETTELKTTNLSGFIRNIEGWEIEVDEIEFLSGEEAYSKAVLDTGCERSRIEECVPSLNNNFYIRDLDKNTKKYEVSPAASVKYMRNAGSPELSDGDFAAIKELYNNPESYMKVLPFHFEVKNGEITKIEEQYLP